MYTRDRIMPSMPRILLFFAVCALCACAPREPLPKVLLVEESQAFPSGIPRDFRAGSYALECEYGYYTDRHIDECDLKRTHGREVRLEPGGKGKIYTRYALWPDSNLFSPPGTSWGYTFTIHTTDNGIITKCSATQQLLDRR